MNIHPQDCMCHVCLPGTEHAGPAPVRRFWPYRHHCADPIYITSPIDKVGRFEVVLASDYMMLERDRDFLLKVAEKAEADHAAAEERNAKLVAELTRAITALKNFSAVTGIKITNLPDIAAIVTPTEVAK